MIERPLVRRLGTVDYEATWREMIGYTASRRADSPDELWLCEHPPVYTLGLAGKREHRLRDNGIPLAQSDRGGQITYHGPGQAVIYVLLDLGRRNLPVRELVRRLEQSVIDFLALHHVSARRVDGAPGVYIEQNGALAKVAALGLRVKKRCCYHGLSINVDMDLSPFLDINPCGYAGMRVTQTKDLNLALTVGQVSAAVVEQLMIQLEQGDER